MLELYYTIERGTQWEIYLLRMAVKADVLQKGDGWAGSVTTGAGNATRCFR